MVSSILTHFTLYVEKTSLKYKKTQLIRTAEATTKKEATATWVKVGSKSCRVTCLASVIKYCIFEKVFEQIWLQVTAQKSTDFASTSHNL